LHTSAKLQGVFAKRHVH